MQQHGILDRETGKPVICEDNHREGQVLRADGRGCAVGRMFLMRCIARCETGLTLVRYL